MLIKRPNGEDKNNFEKVIQNNEDIEEKAEEDSSVLPEEETKVETEPEDVDVEELRREVEEKKDSDTNDTDHDDN